MSAVVACERLDALLPAMPDPRGWLSPQEGARLEAIRHERRRAQFLAARWQVRQVLASVEGGDAARWMLTAPADAPPTVAGRAGLHLAISHSGGWVACAVGREAIGLDIEAPRRRRDIAGLVELCCTPRERQLFAACAPEQADALFHELWTVKESWIKRRGEGLAPARLARIEAVPATQGAVSTWRGEGWFGAVCTEGDVRWAGMQPDAIRHWQVRDL